MSKAVSQEREHPTFDWWLMAEQAPVTFVEPVQGVSHIDCWCI